MIVTTEQIKNQLIPRVKKYVEQNAGDSTTDTRVIDLSGYAKIYVGSVAPTDTSVIWFDTSAYLDE